MFIERGRTGDALQSPLNDTYDFIIGKTCSPHMTFKTVQTPEKDLYIYKNIIITISNFKI